MAPAFFVSPAFLLPVVTGLGLEFLGPASSSSAFRFFAAAFLALASGSGNALAEIPICAIS